MLNTLPRQVRLLKCAILSPGLEQRGSTASDKDTLKNYGFDVTPYVQKIDIFENIFDNTLSGTLTLLESVGLVEYLPIVGVETLAIAFSVEDSNGQSRTFARSFRICKVGDVQFPRHDWRLYTLKFVTNEFISSMSSRICRAFNNRTALDSVTEILQTDLQVPTERFITKEKTFDDLNIVIPNYTPLKAINYFTLLAQTADTKESNFLFFETLDGFHFTSISRLIREGSKGELRVFNVNPGQVTTAPTLEDSVARNAIMKIHQEQGFDLLADIASGTLRAQMVHFDFLARKVDHELDSRYSETFSKTTHLDKYPVYPKNFDLTVSQNVRMFAVPSNVFSAKSNYSKSKGEDDTLQRLHESVVLRNRQMREIRHLQTIINLPGQPDLRAGRVVVVNYPSSKTLEGHEVTINTPTYTEGTPYYSGKHLVTSVQHSLVSKGGDSMEYRMTLRVCRDSLGSPLIGTSSEKGK